MTGGRGERPGPYLIFALGLSLFALAILGAQTLLKLDPRTATILEAADFFVCILFLVDFGVTMWRSENRWRYFFRWGWLDLLSSIPAVDALRVGRAARVLRILRVLRGLRSTKVLAEFLLTRRAHGVFLAASLLSLLVVVTASVSILLVETAPESNIKSAEDALWWSFVTITTVGYGDRFPVTTEGRMLGVLLMVAGISLFGTISGVVASWFVSAGQEHQESEIDLLRKEIADLRRLIEEKRSP